MNALEIAGLRKRFGSHVVLDDLTMEVHEGEVFGFIGQNGAGKTTTMKAILGLLQVDEGEMQVFGEKVRYGQTETNKMVGYLPDVPAFYGYMRPGEYLRLCGEICGMDQRAIKRKSLELLEMVGLTESAKKKIGGFSRGMKQRLGLAQALLAEPRLLICDEPTSALDPAGRKEILDIMRQVKGKTTVVFSTHVLSDVERICDTVAVLHKGKIALSGSLQEIKTKHRADSLEVEFAESQEAQRLQAEIGGHMQAEIDGCVLSVKTGNLPETESEILGILSAQNLMPVRLEIAEPTLENLFMEVIK
ncbi:Daunorubicin/doxorubicin resistance ATP-binding protein DrrA [uncultured Eubacterium sp.]|nr:Daunorubicin/doxorubicin resistance ATP-binding protein DrrA [uncultured Eubacterium sp.]